MIYKSQTDVWTRKQALEIDKLSTSEFNIAELSLMEEAGKATALFVLNKLKYNSKVLVICGPGNNGGDGLVAARHLLGKVEEIRVFLVKEESSVLSTSCKEQISRFSEGFLEVYNEGSLEGLGEETLLIDALLGLGQIGELREGVYKKALEEASKQVWNSILAVDLPSGLNADCWSQKAILSCDHSITFGARKLAHCLQPAKDDCGEVEVVEISFAEEAIKKVRQESSPIELDREIVRNIDPWQDLKSYAHKYDRGHVLVIGGSDGKLGAPIIAASAAFYSGAGWVSVALSSGLKQCIGAPVELSYENFYLDGVLNMESLRQFVIARRVKAICIGPGMMRSPFNAGNWTEFLDVLNLVDFCLIDAGALEGIGELLDVKAMEGKCLLSPHPKEWLKIHHDNVEIASLEELQAAKLKIEKWGVEVFYKTASPFTLGKACPTLINNEADVSIAKAGTGDLLAGIATILGVRNPTDILANVCQSYIAWTAQKRKDKLGFHGLSASDIARHISSVIGQNS